MSRIEVHLNTNGEYWQARWTTTEGERRSVGLGRRTRDGGKSKRTAKAECRELEAKLNADPLLAAGRRAPCLGDYLATYMKHRAADLEPSTLKLHESTAAMLRGFFGDAVPIDRISKARCADWYAALCRGELTRTDSPSGATIAKNVRNAKTMFNHAVDLGLLSVSPFNQRKLKGNAPPPPNDWQYVDLVTLYKLFRRCPHQGWRAFLGLCRLGGLRKGEALALRWCDIDWAKNAITVDAEKTHQRRTVPMHWRLERVLLKAEGAAVVGGERVCDPLAKNNLYRGFDRIGKRAGVVLWGDPFQTLRRNRATDWAQEVMPPDLAKFMGHSVAVAEKYYLQVPPEVFERVVHSAQRLAQSKGDDRTRGRKSLSHRMGPLGLEPRTNGLKGRCSTD